MLIVVCVPLRSCCTVTLLADIGFYLSNHNLAYECAVFPKSDDCVNSNAIEKNSQSNIFIEFEIEVDGGFGPYQMCNPEHGWDTANWECLTYCEEPPNCPTWKSQHNSLEWMGPTCFCENGRSNKTVGRVNQTDNHHHTPPKNWPKQCDAAGLVDISAFGYCLNSSDVKVIKTLPSASVADCCTACGALNDACSGWVMPDGPGGACMIVTGEVDDFEHVSGKNKCLAGFKFNHGIGHISDGVLGGFWYSTPTAGECTGEEKPGDGSGCTWRVASEGKHVNSSCVNAFIDEVVESAGHSCFSKCAQPRNEKTACYATCFAQTINGNATAGILPMTKEAIVAPFSKAFASNNPKQGGCPDVRKTALDRDQTWGVDRLWVDRKVLQKV